MPIAVKLDVVKLEAAAQKLRAMAHPMRIAIIELLDENNALNVTEIHKALNLDQAKTSHHLNILRNKGVVKATRKGKNIYYTLRNDSLIEIITCINRCNAN